MNKKGAEFTINTLVIIVLAIIVLVVLALGFGTGWANMWSKISGYFSPVNIDAVKQACQYACTTQSSYAYCNQSRDLSYSDDNNEKQKIIVSCNSWVNNKNITWEAIAGLPSASLDCSISCS